MLIVLWSCLTWICEIKATELCSVVTLRNTVSECSVGTVVCHVVCHVVCVCVFRVQVDQLKAENAQLLLQLSQDKLDIADLNKRYSYLLHHHYSSPVSLALLLAAFFAGPSSS